MKYTYTFYAEWPSKEARDRGDDHFTYLAVRNGSLRDGRYVGFIAQGYGENEPCLEDANIPLRYVLDQCALVTGDEVIDCHPKLLEAIEKWG